MIKVVANNLGSGDWVTVRGFRDEVLFEGHRIGPQDLVDILNATLDQGAEFVEVTDEQMEEGAF